MTFGSRTRLNISNEDRQIESLQEEVKELKAALLDIVKNKPINTNRTNLGDALDRHAALIKSIKESCD